MWQTKGAAGSQIIIVSAYLSSFRIERVTNREVIEMLLLDILRHQESTSDSHCFKAQR